MSNLIPAVGHVALIRRTPANSTPYVTRHPVIAWDEHGKAYVHDPEWGGLRWAGEIGGFRGTQAVAAPIVSAVPAVGWTAEFEDAEGKTMAPVVAWLVRADGTTEPLVVGTDGSGFDPTTVDGFLHIVAPGEAP